MIEMLAPKILAKIIKLCPLTNLKHLFGYQPLGSIPMHFNFLPKLSTMQTCCIYIFVQNIWNNEKQSHIRYPDLFFGLQIHRASKIRALHYLHIGKYTLNKILVHMFDLGKCS